MRTTFTILSVSLALACGRGDDATTDTAVGASAGGMAGMDHRPAKDADHDFLRQMADHHEGLVQMASTAMTKASKSATQGDAHNLHTKQAAERDSMLAMIRSTYGETHMPMVMEKNRAQNDSLQRLSGAEYDRTFYRLVVDHHREGIAMIDATMQRLTKDDVKRMAEKMKSDQQKEIAEFQRKASGD